MKKKLLQDIVISKGTLFTDAPSKTERAPGSVQAVIGLTKDSAGFIEFFCRGWEAGDLKDWFEDA